MKMLSCGPDDVPCLLLLLLLLDQRVAPLNRSSNHLWARKNEMKKKWANKMHLHLSSHEKLIYLVAGCLA